ncbi:major facilitator superfamily domain-containing protein [Abortiporus biennis]|nr:major facilitator superfamily domain-containing protein [Abortiporus biennis]
MYDSPSKTGNVDNKKEKLAVVENVAAAKIDIEHAEVADDPRQWSRTRKGIILSVISAAAMIAGLGANILNPAIAEIQSELHASNSKISLSLSLFILIQGAVPLVWSAFSEIYGRKKIYLSSLALCTIGCVVSAVAKSVNVLIGMRCIQGAGSSAVISIGAATLADIYDPHERGTMMGLYYSAPLLGPVLGPILGGALTQGFDWRATFWFLVIFTGLCFVMFIFFTDTFRKERSLTYQTVLRRVAFERESQQSRSSVNQETVIKTERTSEKESQDVVIPVNRSKEDVEAQVTPSLAKPPADIKEIKPTLSDVNPVRPIVMVVLRLNNLVILFSSGFLFAFAFCINYTCSRTLSDKYGYNALQIGLVLLSYGIVVAYGWICEKHVHVSAVCVMLFLAGFFSISIYASTLAYIVDANVGRSSSAAATNSLFRGIAAEVAVPIQTSIGDGGLYSL